MSATIIPSRTGIANLPLSRVDRKTYDQSIELLAKAINKTKLGIGEKREAMGRLERVRMV
jgi:hypothetical protein